MEFLLLNQIKSVIRKLSSRLTVLISIFFLSFKLFVLIHCLIPHGREQVKYYFCQRGRDPALITEPAWTFQLLIAYGMGYTRKVPCLCSTTYLIHLMGLVLASKKDLSKCLPLAFLGKDRLTRSGNFQIPIIAN